MRRPVRTRPTLLAIVLSLAMVSASCSGSDTVEISRQSEPRAASTDDDAPSPTGDFGAYCDAADEVRGSIESFDDDPERSLEGLAELAELAPDELRDDFEVAIDRVGQLENLDEDDPSSFSKVFEILLAPDLLDALAAIDEFTLDACGFTLDPGVGDESGSNLDDDLFDDDPFDDDSSISLDDIDEIKEDNEDASWADKLVSTFISNGSTVQLSALPGALSDDEALEVCEVMLAGLSIKNPDVTVAVLSEDTSIAESSGDGTCSLS